MRGSEASELCESAGTVHGRGLMDDERDGPGVSPACPWYYVNSPLVDPYQVNVWTSPLPGHPNTPC